MLILALETANSQCSVALWQDGSSVFFEQNNDLRAPTQHILPMFALGMNKTGTTWQQLTAIAFSRGPGAFSGVRINAAVAQAIAWAHDLPVVAVSSLQALAQHAFRHNGLIQVSAVIDARMDEVYCADYCVENDIMQPTSDEQLLSYAAAQARLQFPPVGSGARLLDRQDTANAHDWAADARDIAELAAFAYSEGLAVEAAQALPVYLRDNAWKKISEQKTVTL